MVWTAITSLLSSWSSLSVSPGVFSTSNFDEAVFDCFDEFADQSESAAATTWTPEAPAA